MKQKKEGFVKNKDIHETKIRIQKSHQTKFSSYFLLPPSSLKKKRKKKLRSITYALYLAILDNFMEDPLIDK